MWAVSGKTTYAQLGEKAMGPIAKIHNNLCCFGLLTVALRLEWE
jgi:hypothetical protein